VTKGDQQVFALVVRFDVLAEHVDDFDALVEQTLLGIESEPGTLIYLSHVRTGSPNERVFYEAYADREAFEAHEATDHTRRFLDERMQHLAAEPEVWWLTGVDGAIRTAD
jgi:quinol monooxygenase YgiN